jgi:hypothetical protein
MTVRRSFALVSSFAALLAFAACGDDDDDRYVNDPGRNLGTETGAECGAPADCFDDIPDGEIQGEVRCLDRVTGGYCTHLCTDDSDCCAAQGECAADEVQVCGPFESTGLMMCFISCESADVGGQDETEFCQGFHKDFNCRSTGGGSANRKVCVPGGGGLCGAYGDCPADWGNCCEEAAGGSYRCYNDADAGGRNCYQPG